VRVLWVLNGEWRATWREQAVRNGGEALGAL
jgi:hypothetical protein